MDRNVNCDDYVAVSTLTTVVDHILITHSPRTSKVYSSNANNGNKCAQVRIIYSTLSSSQANNPIFYEC